MSLEIFLSGIIQKVRGVELTPVLMLAAVFSFLFLLIFYHWSGLAEKVENLTAGKKAVAFFFITLIIIAFYYIFYKAGKFDEIINNSVFNGILIKIGDIINRWSN